MVCILRLEKEVRKVFPTSSIGRYGDIVFVRFDENALTTAVEFHIRANTFLEGELDVSYFGNHLIRRSTNQNTNEKDLVIECATALKEYLEFKIKHLQVALDSMEIEE